MQNTITFDISSDVHLPAVPGVDDQPGTPAELYGATFAGDIVVRDPTIEEQLGNECRAIAAIESFGIRDSGNVLTGTFEFLNATLFFDTCAVGERPSWLKKDAPASAKSRSAVIHAYQRARRELEDRKKKPADSGASASAAT